jgi:hypothetical protein
MRFCYSECSYGISCDSPVPSHYKKWRHNGLAEYHDGGPDAVEAYQLSGMFNLKQLASNESKYIFLFACFGHPLKVINHWAHENQTGSLAQNLQV